MGLALNAGPISAAKQAIPVMTLNCFEEVSNFPDWKSANNIGAINRQGKIEDKPALKAPKKKILTAHFPAMGSRVLAISRTFVTTLPS